MKRFSYFIFICALVFYTYSSLSFAQEEFQDVPSSKGDLPEEEDYSESAYTEFGEFDEKEDEASMAKFFQYGRFFGVSAGLGYQGLTGSRGLLWEGGFPLTSFNVLYWFDFHFALQLGGYIVKHSYVYTNNNNTTNITDDDTFENVRVGFNRIGLDFKYYINTVNLSAPVSFANPFVMFGIGNYTKTEENIVSNNKTTLSAVGLSAGGGLEFAITHKKTYFYIEGALHAPSFDDEDDPINEFDDQKGFFYTFTGNLLFTW